MKPNFEYLVNRRLQEWATRQVAPRPAAPPIVVCVSREHGSGGAVLAALLARRLGFQLFDKKLVEEIAAQSGAGRRMIATVDERAQSGIERWVTSVFESGAFTDSEYLRGLVRVLRAIAAHGDAVVVGRGAQFALAPEATLRLRVVAPKAVRVTRIAHRDRLLEEDARAQVREMDARWRAYVQHHFQADIDDPAHYDVVINTGCYGIPASMDLVLAAFRARFGYVPEMPLGNASATEEHAPVRSEGAGVED